MPSLSKSIFLFFFAIILSYSSSKALNPPIVSGAFIQLNSNNASNDAPWWQEVVANMSKIGIDTIIIQYSAINSISFYPVKNLEISEYYSLSPQNNNPIESILAAADKANIAVFLGLGLEQSFVTTYNSRTNQFEFDYDKNLVIVKAKLILDELYQTYGYKTDDNSGHKSLQGWYLPNELSDADIIRSGHKVFLTDILDYYSQLSSHAHEKTGLKTMISPYFAAADSFTDAEPRQFDKYAKWWQKVLDKKRTDRLYLDIIAHQDSVGVGHLSINEASIYLHRLEPIVNQYGLELWANLEAFRVDKNNNFASAKFTDFKKQIEAYQGIVDKEIMFEFSTYMEGPSNKLFDNYLNYLCPKNSFYTQPNCSR